MSRLQISRSPDLQRLRSEGFDIEVRGGHLLVKVPYVNTAKQVKNGTFVCVLTLAGDVTTTPADHVVQFMGEYPCHADGTPIEKIRNASNRQDLGDGITIDHTFSARPLNGPHADYYAKMTTYVAMLEGEAQRIDPTASARTFPLVLNDGVENEGPFKYIDTSVTSMGIGAMAKKLAVGKMAIIGLGGTGSYVLDLVAKTPVQIELFDGDILLQKNAFRAPSAASIEELTVKPMKVHYFRDLYTKMRDGIIAHPIYVDAASIEMLREMKFVFICIDRGSARKMIAAKLEEFGVPFIDVGMGVQVVDDKLTGLVRVTTSTRERRAHFAVHAPFGDEAEENEYNKNIQIADLNALNAALAVIRWKKLCGFYADLEREYQAVYALTGNTITNAEQG